MIGLSSLKESLTKKAIVCVTIVQTILNYIYYFGTHLLFLIERKKKGIFQTTNPILIFIMEIVNPNIGPK